MPARKPHADPPPARKPRRRRRPTRLPSEGTIAILTRLLSSRHSVVLNGEAQEVTVIEAITLQLMQKAVGGEKRALRGLLRYQQFASRRLPKAVRIKFVDGAYTRKATGRAKEPGRE